jgi:hypothetical protein
MTHRGSGIPAHLSLVASATPKDKPHGFPSHLPHSGTVLSPTRPLTKQRIARWQRDRGIDPTRTGDLVAWLATNNARDDENIRARARSR